jgi:hypothetical protein
MLALSKHVFSAKKAAWTQLQKIGKKKSIDICWMLKHLSVNLRFIGKRLKSTLVKCSVRTKVMDKKMQERFRQNG